MTSRFDPESTLHAAPCAGEVPALRLLLGRDDASLPQVWAARVERTPDRPFLRWQTTTWTYAQAWLEIRRVAGYLRSIGLAGTGARVATFLTNCPEAVWIWFGTHAAGCVLVSLNRSHRGPILADMLARAGASMLVTEPTALEDLPPLPELGIEQLVLTGADRPPLPSLPSLPPVTTYRAVASTEPFLAPLPGPSDLASVMFTSGTTGRSKAVKLPHNMFCRGGARVAERFGFTAEDVFHVWLPLYHIAGQLHAVSSMLAAGGCVALYPTFSRSRFWRQVEESGATVLGAMPNVLSLLSDLPPRPGGDRTTLRVGLVGLLPAGLQQAFEKRFGVRLHDTYGMTEMEPITLPDPGRPSPPGSCGVANPDFDVAVMDDRGELLPPGAGGEIVARPRAPGLMMQGYEHDDAATVALWRDLWWHTGDLGRIDADGFLYIQGRLKHMIRRRGENISAWELEQALKTHPEVADAAAVGVPSPLGEEDVKVVVVARPGSRLEPPAIHAFCRSRLARFMVPRFIEVREALPYTFIGKVDREQLRLSSDLTWDAEGQPAQSTPSETRGRP